MILLQHTNDERRILTLLNVTGGDLVYARFEVTTVEHSFIFSLFGADAKSEGHNGNGEEDDHARGNFEWQQEPSRVGRYESLRAGVDTLWPTVGDVSFFLRFCAGAGPQGGPAIQKQTLATLQGRPSVRLASTARPFGRAVHFSTA